MQFILNEFKLKELGISDEQIEKLKEDDSNISFFSLGPCEVRNVMESNLCLSYKEAKEIYKKIYNSTKDMSIDLNDSTWEMVDLQIASELRWNKTFLKYIEELEELKSYFED